MKRGIGVKKELAMRGVLGKRILLSLVLLIMLEFLVSCKKQYEAQEATSESYSIQKDDDELNADDENDTALTGRKNTLSITEAYIVPDPIDDILLRTVPETVEERTATNRIISTITETINPKIEIYKYLEKKREYAKTSIFNDIP